MTNVIIKHWRLVSVILGIIIFLLILYWLRNVIFPFAVALVLAYLLMPIVNWLEEKLPPRGKWPDFRRVVSVLIAFILLIVIIGGFAYFIVTAVIDATTTLLESAPALLTRSLYQVRVWLQGIIESLPVEIQQEVNEAVSEVGSSIGGYIRDAILGSISTISGAFGLILGFAVLPFFLFYLLKDSEKLKNALNSAMILGASAHSRNVLKIIERVLGRYIRAQIMLGLIVAYFTFIGLLILAVPYKIALALLAGVCEVIPTLGPWIGGAIAVVVTLAVVPEKALWVAVLFICVQLVENNLFVPKIQSAYLRIHPAVMIFLLVLGAYVAGFWGLLLIGPLTATLVEIFKYIRDYYRRQQPPKLIEPEQLV